MFRNIKAKLFSKYLFYTNTASCGILLATGDIIEQRIEMRKSHKLHDWRRTSRMFTVGFCIGPFNHLWYTNLDRWMPGTSRKIILKKLLADQILAAPIFCFIFFMGMGLLEKKRLEPIYSEWVQKFPFIYLMDCIFWPPVQVVNFSYVPTKYRVMYVNSFTLLWDTFLSFSKHTL